MEYRDRLPKEETDWIKSRIVNRKEQQQDWATFIGMSKSMFSKIVNRSKPLPERFEDKWIEMEDILKGEEICETIKQEKKWTPSNVRHNR